ncbi:MAG: O-antigen ligase family protein [Verrucomicrobia bacterium]|nr:O-antigen ligase family protein [Verrucomicrobiota bacterium]
MTLDRAIGDAPRWMFLVILVYAPWAYGCTREVTSVVLSQFSAVLMMFWLVGCVWRRRWPRVAWVPAVLLTLLLLQGWWMAWNAHSYHVYRTWTTVARIWDNPPLPAWPGAIDRYFAQRAMLNFTAMTAFFLFACDLMSRPAWRKRVWLTLALTAVSVAIGGTVLHLGGPSWREWIWDSPVAQYRTTFATYRYHGNAASLMSIGWALVLGWTITAASQRAQPLRLAGWVVASLCMVFGLFMNTSRAGWALAVLIALLVGARFLWAWWRTAREHFAWKAGLVQAALLVAVAGTLAAVALSADWGGKLARLNATAEAIQKRYPTEVYHALVREIAVLGHGPDCFQMALPPYMEAFGLANEQHGFWQHAHNDYYEYLANWGWWGLALWVWLIGGGLWLGLRDHLRLPALWGSTQWVLGCCGCAAMIGILVHARWDFPLEKPSILLYFLTLVADGWARALQPKGTPGTNLPASF